MEYALSRIQRDLLLSLIKTTSQEGLFRLEIIKKVFKTGGDRRTTAYDNLKTLRKKGFVDKFSELERHRQGRPKTFWFITQLGKEFIRRNKNRLE